MTELWKRNLSVHGWVNGQVAVLQKLLTVISHCLETHADTTYCIRDYCRQRGRRNCCTFFGHISFLVVNSMRFVFFFYFNTIQEEEKSGFTRQVWFLFLNYWVIYNWNFEVFAAIELRIPFLWDVTACQWVIGSRLFEGTWCPHLQGSVGPSRFYRTCRP